MENLDQDQQFGVYNGDFGSSHPVDEPPTIEPDFSSFARYYELMHPGLGWDAKHVEQLFSDKPADVSIKDYLTQHAAEQALND